MLNLHPHIQKAAGEVHFFDRDENYLKGLEWYRRKMPHSFRGQITIEKSPSYFVTPEVSVAFHSEKLINLCFYVKIFQWVVWFDFGMTV
jgi:superoxide dismutase